MPFSPGGIRIDPANQTAVVSFTILNGGGTPIAYSSIGGSGTLALPATITTPTTFYFAEQTQFVVSALVGGVQAASPSGGTVAVDLSSEGTAALTLSVPGSVALTKSAADATYSALAPVVEGQNLRTEGASWEGADVFNRTAATRYPHRVARRLGMTIDDHAISGSFTQDQWLAKTHGDPIAGGSGNVAPVGTVGLVLISSITNNVIYGAAVPTATELAAFRNALEASIYRSFAKTVIPASDGSVTYSSGWTDANPTQGAATFPFKQKTGVSDASATATCAAPSGTDYVIIGVTSSVAAAPQSVRATADGTQKYAISPPSPIAASLSGVTYGPVVLPVTSLASGTHSLVLQSQSGAGGGFVGLDSVYVLNTGALPQVVILKLPQIVPNAIPNPIYNAATIDAYRTAVDTVVAKVLSEYPASAGALTVCDPMTNPNWTITDNTLIAPSTFHPNDRGMAVLAESLGAHIVALPWRNALARLAG